MGPLLYSLIFITTLLQLCFAPPVIKTKEEQTAEEADVLQDYMEYHRYLRQVVSALESDPEFRKKLESAAEEDIKSGKIAHELEFVDHNIRTRLDELKRTELQRLKDLVRQKEILGNEVDGGGGGGHHHLDASNPHTFEINDLRNLILKTTADLQEADKKRKDEFKQYEMQKEYDKQNKLNQTIGEAREKLEKEYQRNEQQHKKHDKLHEPGHKAQLEEVWEQQDQMQQDFDPKAFFMLHDLDSNRLWDQDEVKALFIKELDKMYKAGSHEDDMRERIEEMERMRETVFIEMDMNRDGFIDFNEFLAQTKRQEFQRDNGWQGIDEQKQYTNEELEEYISRHHAMQNGHYPPGAYPQHGVHPNQQQPPYYDPQMGHPGQMGQNMPPHPNQIPQQGQFQQQYPPQQVPPQGGPQFPNSQQQQQRSGGNLNTNEIYSSHHNQNQQPNMVASPNVQYVQSPNQQNIPNNQQQQFQNLSPEQQQQFLQQQQLLLQQYQQQQLNANSNQQVKQQQPNSINSQQANGKSAVPASQQVVNNLQQQDNKVPNPNVIKP